MLRWSSSDLTASDGPTHNGVLPVRHRRNRRARHQPRHPQSTSGSVCIPVDPAPLARCRDHGRAGRGHLSYALCRGYLDGCGAGSPDICGGRMVHRRAMRTTFLTWSAASVASVISLLPATRSTQRCLRMSIPTRRHVVLTNQLGGPVTGTPAEAVPPSAIQDRTAAVNTPAESILKTSSEKHWRPRNPGASSDVMTQQS